MYVIHKLLAKGAELRHSFLLSEEQRRSVSGYTLLLRDIPTPLRDPSKLFVLFDRIQPGCVHSVVVLKKSRTLDHYARKRLKARNALEHEITKYLQNLVHNSSGNRRRGSVTPESDPTDQMERGEKRQVCRLRCCRLTKPSIDQYSQEAKGMYQRTEPEHVSRNLG